MTKKKGRPKGVTKERVNVSIDAELMKRARAQNLNISEVAAAAVLRAVRAAERHSGSTS